MDSNWLRTGSILRNSCGWRKPNLQAEMLIMGVDSLILKGVNTISGQSVTYGYK